MHATNDCTITPRTQEVTLNYVCIVILYFYVFQSTRVAAATKIQAVYRGHTVRKRRHWTDEKITSERSGNTAPALTADRNVRDMLNEHVVKPTSFPSASHGTRMDMEQSLSEASSDDVQFTNIRPFYKTERLNNDLQVCGFCVGSLSGTLLYFLLCLMPDDFVRQVESAAMHSHVVALY
jgi:hypothetical protein